LDVWGYKTKTTAIGAQGAELARKRYFNVILTDIVMPEMDGVVVYRRIGEISPSSSVIMMTGYSPARPLVRSAINCGVKRLLHKPFQINTLDAIESSTLNLHCVYQVYLHPSQ
jgi:YesN/AraC family two-component response regulator